MLTMTPSHNLSNVQLCATKLRDLFITQWHLQLSGASRNQTDTSKLRFYKLFKVAFRRKNIQTLSLIFNLESAYLNSGVVIIYQKLKLGDTRNLRLKSVCVNYVKWQLKLRSISCDFVPNTTNCDLDILVKFRTFPNGYE